MANEVYGKVFEKCLRTAVIYGSETLLLASIKDEMLPMWAIVRMMIVLGLSYNKSSTELRPMAGFVWIL